MKNVRAWILGASLGLLGLGCAADAEETSDATASSASSQTQLGHVLDMAAAEQTTEQLSNQLDAELARVGPGLTRAQQNAYVAQFAKDSAPTVAAAHQKYDAAADQISAYLKTRTPEVIAFAKQRAPTSSNGEELYMDYLVLARTKHADETMRFMNSLAHDPAFARLMAIEPHFYDDPQHPKPAEVVAEAVPYFVANELANHATPEATIASLDAVLGKSLSGSAITTYKGAFGTIDLARAARVRGRDHLDALLPVPAIDKIADRAVAKAVVGAGAAFSIWSAKDSLVNGDFNGFLQSIAGATSDTLVIVGQLAESIHAFKPFAEALVEVGERIGPGIDLVLGAVSATQDVASVLQNADPALKTKLFGDAMTTIGAVIVFANPAFGAAVMGVGAAVAFVSQIVFDRNAEAAAAAAIEARTAKVVGGASASTIAKALTTAQDDHLWDISEYPLDAWYGKQRLGLTAQQIQSIAGRAPDFVRLGSGSDNGTTGLASLEAKCLVASTSTANLQRARDRLYAVLEAAIGAGGSDGLLLLASSMNHDAISIASCDGWKALLANVAQHGAPDLARAAAAAGSVLATP